MQEFLVGLAAGLVVAVVFTTLLSPKAKINTMIDLNKKKSVHSVNIQEIEDADGPLIAMCRCWKSKKFPYCDGSHNALNESGDNPVTCPWSLYITVPGHVLFLFRAHYC